jgi:hypothetical protein
MTDELLYERLAISIAKLGSPLPHIHGELIGNVNQLYPLLLAPLFHDRLVPPALHDAHVLNAFVMSSVCLPTFLLARDVTRSKRLSYVVASLCVCIPWIPLSSMLMTGVHLGGTRRVPRRGFAATAQRHRDGCRARVGDVGANAVPRPLHRRSHCVRSP